MKPVIGRNSQDSRSCPAGGSWKRLIQKRGVLLREKRMQGASLCAEGETIWKESIALSLAMYSGWYYLRRSLPGAPGQKRPDDRKLQSGHGQYHPANGKGLGPFGAGGRSFENRSSLLAVCSAVSGIGPAGLSLGGAGRHAGPQLPVWAGFAAGKAWRPPARFCFCFPAWCGSCIVLGGCGAGHGIFAGGRRGDHHGGAAAGLALRGRWKDLRWYWRQMC